MSLKMSLAGARAGIATVVLAISSLGLQAAALAPVMLSNSVRPVAAVSASGPTGAHKAYVSRSTLKPSESAAMMNFEVALKMRNFADMKARVQNGEHISAQELVAKYEPLPSDYQSVVDWLTGHGFTITRRDSHHMAIFARGSVSQIAQAAQVGFARVTLNGTEYTSAVTAPSVPASIAPLLLGINGLQPHLHPHKQLMKKNAGSGGALYTPAQIAKAYQATALYNSNINGAGQTIAIVMDSIPAPSDLVAFWDYYGINQSINNIHITNVISGTLPVPPSTDDPYPGSEVSLDTEWSSAMAPGAKIRIYATTQLLNQYLDDAYEQVYEDASNNPALGIHQMSMSYGQGEIETTDGQMQTDDQYFVELANAGVTCFASSGDNGSVPDVDVNGNPELEPEAPASDPNVIGVGGTTLTLDANNNESTEVVWNDGDSGGAGGGGTSTYWPRPSWQTGTGVPAGTKRLVPDIACSADPTHGADYYYTIPAFDTTPAGGIDSAVGGTSWACPTCAGFCALINQARANVGLPAIGQGGGLKMGARIYQLIGTANFRDITSGNNALTGSGTTNGSPNYTAGTGYDEATGVGVPLVQTLAETFAGTTTLVGVGQASALMTVNQGQTATITVTASGAPVSYQWQRKAVGAGSFSPLSDGSGVYSGSATASLTVSNPTTTMSGDQFQCVVTYSGPITVTSDQPTTLVVETPWSVSTLAGDAGTSGLANNPGTAAQFDYPTGVAVDSSGNLYISDDDNNVIRKVTLSGTTATVSTPYGNVSTAPPNNSGSANGSYNSASFYFPRDLAIDSSDNLYVSDEGNNLIRKIVTTGTQAGKVSTLSASTLLSAPKGICVDNNGSSDPNAGDVFVADSGSNVILKITPSGATTIFAGSSNSTAGYQDGAGTTQALFNQPLGLTIDNSGNLYVTDYNNEAIRKITPGGVVSTVAGGQTLLNGIKTGVAGYLDGTGTQALFNLARGITVDSSGNLYVTDSYPSDGTDDFSGNNVLRKITPAGVVTTLAGQASVWGSGDGIGSGAQFFNPVGLAMTSSGTIYIADAGNDTIRSALEPVTSLTATIPYAAVIASTTGQFTVARTGSTAASLTLNYSVANASTAVAGIDYTALASPVTIPAGASSATITVTPLTNAAATANRTVQLSLTSSSNGTVVNPNPATVTLIEAQPVTFTTWQSNHPDPATPLGDSVPDLAKYVFDIDPSVPMTSSERAALPTSGMMTSGNSTYFTLTYRESAGLSGTTTVTPQVSSDMMQTWTAAPTPTVIGIDSTTQDPILQVQVPYNGGPEFLRLNVMP